MTVTIGLAGAGRRTAVAARRGTAVLPERPIASDLAGAADLAVAAARTISQVALTPA
jgi:predicted dehydrogenase